jgi:hypothetical protein
VLGSCDKIYVNDVALCLRLLLGLLLCAPLGGRLGDVFLLPSLRPLVLPEDGFDRLLTRGELGGESWWESCAPVCSLGLGESI